MLGWTDPRRFGSAVTYVAPDGSYCELPDFFDPLAGPGTLFAAARERWAECEFTLEQHRTSTSIQFESWPDAEPPENGDTFVADVNHPLLCHALALAMVEAAIQERDNA